MTDLNSLARTLAERLTLDVAELPDRTSPDDWPEAMLITDSELRQMAEAVIREAIEKTRSETLEEAWRFVVAIGDEYREQQKSAKGRDLDEVVAMTIGANTCAAAIRSLKQSNSGRVEQGLAREN